MGELPSSARLDAAERMRARRGSDAVDAEFPGVRHERIERYVLQQPTLDRIAALYAGIGVDAAKVRAVQLQHLPHGVELTVIHGDGRQTRNVITDRSPQ